MYEDRTPAAISRASDSIENTKFRNKIRICRLAFLLDSFLRSISRMQYIELHIPAQTENRGYSWWCLKRCCPYRAASSSPYGVRCSFEPTVANSPTPQNKCSPMRAYKRCFSLSSSTYVDRPTKYNQSRVFISLINCLIPAYFKRRSIVWAVHALQF